MSVRAGVRAIVPLKPMGQAKGRLRPVLADAERERLVRWMLARVVASLGRATGLAGTLVVGSDRHVVPEDARFVADPGGGLNAALAHAIATVSDARAVLIVPADVPLIREDDVAAILAAAARTVIVPDAAGVGTNALLLTPPDRFATAFGEGSLARHMALAEATGEKAKVLDLPRVALDVDDAAALAELGRHTDVPLQGAPA